MKLSLAIVAGAMLLQVATSLAEAGEPGWGGQVTKVQFVAPEPTPADPSQRTDPGEAFIEETPSDAAYSPDASFTAKAAGPIGDGIVPAGDFGWANQSHCCDPCSGARGGCARCVACRMPQHYAYFPPMHGYYYFRPYNASQVPTQQTFGQMMGEDPANPYSNRIFQTVYEQYRADKMMEQPVIEEQPPVAE